MAPRRVGPEKPRAKPSHQRVCGEKQGWKDLPERATRVLLEWCEKVGVEAVVDGETFLYTYRYEGGKRIVQRNPNRANQPCACVVYLAEGVQ